MGVGLESCQNIGGTVGGVNMIRMVTVTFTLILWSGFLCLEIL